MEFRAICGSTAVAPTLMRALLVREPHRVRHASTLGAVGMNRVAGFSKPEGNAADHLALDRDIEEPADELWIRCQRRLGNGANPKTTRRKHEGLNIQPAIQHAVGAEHLVGGHDGHVRRAEETEVL